MVSEAHRELHASVKRRAGNAYRSAIAYDEDGWEVVYLREELRTPELEGALPELYQTVQSRDAIVTGSAYEALGEPTATTEIHENGVITHFRDRPGRGFVVTLDRTVARQLTGFVDECNEMLDTDDVDDANGGADSDEELIEGS